MATTFETGSQNTFEKDLANTLLSKLDINSKFLNEVVDRALTIASKNLQFDTNKLKQQKESVKQQPKDTVKTKQNNVEKETKTTSTPSTQTTKPQPLSVTNNTFEIVNTPKQETKLLDTVTKTTSEQETLLDKFLKTVEKTTNKLEETVKKVPRPWELTPGTSVGYQMLAGEDEAMTERIRKGLAQFIGRYATNIKEPVGYSLPETFDFKAILKDKPQWLDEKILSKDTNARETLYREMFDLPSRQTKESGLTKIGPKEYTLDKGSLAPTIEDNITFYDPAARESDEKRNERIRKRLPEPEFSSEQGVSKYKEQIAANPKWAETLSYQARDPNVLGNYTPRFDPTTKSFNYKDVWDIISPPDKTKDYDGTGVSERLRQLIAPILRPATVSGTIETGLTKEVSTKLEKMPVFSSLTKGLDSLKNNKWIDGLKEISSIAPSIKPIISILTAKDEPLKIIEPQESLDISKTFNNLKNEIKDSTLTKLTSWTDNLYNWSKEKVDSFTESLEEPFKSTEKLKTKTLTNFKLPKIDTAQTTEFLYKNIIPETGPSLQNLVNKDNLGINNETLFKIASNTEKTNTTMQLLGNAILRLAQTMNTGSKKQNNIIMPPIQNQNSAPVADPDTPASYAAATNQDPITSIRRQFLYSSE